MATGCSCAHPFLKGGASHDFDKNRIRCKARARPVRPAAGTVPIPDVITADYIISASKIYTMDVHKPVVTAMAMNGKDIIAVGTVEEMNAYKTDKTKEVDYAKVGYTIVPGLIDAHMHSAFSKLRKWLDVGRVSGNCNTMDDAAKKIVDAMVDAKDEDTWILGNFIDPAIMKGDSFNWAKFEKMALEAGDGVSKKRNNPIFVLESNGHVAYANERAFDLAEIDVGFEFEQPGRAVIDETTNQFTGRLEEAPAFTRFILAMDAAEQWPKPDETVALIQEDFDDAAANGCTTLYDMGLGSLEGWNDLVVMEEVMESKPKVRYGASLVCNPQPMPKTGGGVDGSVKMEGKIGDLYNMAEWFVNHDMKKGEHMERFFVNGIKCWSDGSNQGLSGKQTVDYLDADGEKRGSGTLNYDARQLEYIIKESMEYGMNIAIHANGDGAIDETLLAYENAKKSWSGDWSQFRHRIEHCSIVRPEQFTKMVELGVTPSFLIGHVHYWGAAFRDEILGKERANLLDPCRTAIKAGVKFSFHSDYTVTPMAPLKFVEWAVVRNMKFPPAEDEILNPDECLTVEEALRAVTVDAAWQCELDHLTGSIEKGKRGDLCVLRSDPFEVEQKKIGDIEVECTWLEGEIAYQHP